MLGPVGSLLVGESRRGSEVIRMAKWKRNPTSVGVRFAGRCVCGKRLERAYNRELGIVFWNCFECFPIHEKAEEERNED
jgi:hypothetical protein